MTPLKTQAIPPSGCPFCGYGIDRATGYGTIESGCMAVCLRCGKFLKFDNELNLAALDAREFDLLPDTDRFRMLTLRRRTRRLRDARGEAG